MKTSPTSLFLSTVLLAAGLLAGTPSPATAQSWPNEPAGFSVVLDCPFNAGDPRCGGSLYDEYGTGRTGVPGDAPFSPDSALRVYLPGTQKAGGAQVGKQLDAGVDGFYFSVWWKVNAEFEGTNSSLNKLMFVYSSYPDAFFYYGFFGPRGANTFTFYFETNTTTINNSHLSNTYGDLVHFGNACQVTKNTWYRIESYIKKSTSATSRDGIFRWWLNGRLCGDYSNANFPNGVNRWEFNTTWDGADFNTGGKTQDWIHWYDHLRISVSGGAGGGTKSDTTPPSAPLGLRAN